MSDQGTPEPGQDGALPPPLSERLRGAQIELQAGSSGPAPFAHPLAPALTSIGSFTTPTPASVNIPMPQPQVTIAVDPMSEAPPETNATRKFPPVSVTRFVPVSRIPEESTAPEAATRQPATAVMAETFEPPPAEPASPNQPLVEFTPAKPEPSGLTTFTPVAGKTETEPAPSSAPTPARVIAPAATRPLPRLEAGLSSRISPLLQRLVARTPPAPPSPAPTPRRETSADVEAPIAQSNDTNLPPILQAGEKPLAAPTVAAERREPAQARTRVPALLVVDDNADYRFVVAREMRRLRPNQLRVEEADGAQSALNLLATLVRENERVFLLTDFRMPNQTGVDLVGAARRMHPGQDIQYLVYSGINVRSAPELRALGPEEFMEKPGDLIELRRQMNRLLERWLGPLPQVRVPT